MEHHIVALNCGGCLTDPTVNDDHTHIFNNYSLSPNGF